MMSALKSHAFQTQYGERMGGNIPKQGPGHTDKDHLVLMTGSTQTQTITLDRITFYHPF